MSDSILTSLLQELKTLSAEDRQALADVLSNKQPAVEGAADTRSSRLPCDFAHRWSDSRKNHLGKRVPRSCLDCGVLALHTGEQHGELVDDEEAEATAKSDSAVTAETPVSRDAEAASGSKPKRSRKAA